MLTTVWSTNNEQFYSLEDLPVDDVKLGSIIYRGTAVYPKPSDVLNDTTIIDYIDDYVWNFYGEYSERCTENCTPEAKNELNTFLQAWMGKYLNLTFFVVEDAEPIIVTKELMNQISGKL